MIRNEFLENYIDSGWCCLVNQCEKISECGLKIPVQSVFEMKHMQTAKLKVFQVGQIVHFLHTLWAFCTLPMLMHNLSIPCKSWNKSEKFPQVVYQAESLQNPQVGIQETASFKETGCSIFHSISFAHQLRILQILEVDASAQTWKNQHSEPHAAWVKPALDAIWVPNWWVSLWTPLFPKRPKAKSIQNPPRDATQLFCQGQVAKPSPSKLRGAVQISLACRLF